MLNVNITAQNTGASLACLNRNRITDDKQKETIESMGLSSCQVRCISHGCHGHYHAKR